MLLTVLDSAGATQKVIVKGQEAVVDYSGSIATTNTAQVGAAADNNRSGFFIQNLGIHNMWFNDLGPATEGSGSILLLPNAFINSETGYPVTTGVISVIGTISDLYTLRTW